MKVGKRLLSWLLTIAMIAGVLQTNTVTAYASGKDDPEQLTITSAEVTTADGSALTNGTALKYGDKIYLTLSWTIPNKDATTGAHHTTGDYFKAEIDGVQFDTVVKNVPATDTTTYPNPVAEATVEANGEGSNFYLHYTDEDFLENEDEIKGQLTIEATLSKDKVKVNDDGTCSWTFPGGITYTGTITRDTSNDGLKIEKSFDDNYSSLTERVATIKVTSVGDNTNVKVEDKMDANLGLVSGSIQVGDSSYENFPIDLGDMSDGETKTITYKVNVKSAALGNGNEHNQWNALSNASNTATASADGVSSVSATADVRVNHKWVDKSYEDNGATITWTVTINPSDAKANLNGATIKDTLSTNQDEVTDFSCTDNKISQEEFFSGYTFSEDDYNSYTVTYTTTKNKSGAGKKVYSNSVAFTPKDGSTFTVTSSLPGEGSDPGVSKSYQIEDETKPDIITYTAVVTIPAGYGKIENATFTDTFNPAWGSSMALAEDGEVKMNGDVISGTEGYTAQEKGFTYTWTINESSSEQRFTFTYKAQITDGIAGYWYGNSASIAVGDNKWSGTTSYQYQPYEEPATAPQATKSVDGNSTNSTGTVKWKVQMADASMITSTDQELVLVDTLPEGLEYVANSAQLVGYNENGWLKEDPIALTPAKGTDEDGNTTLSFTIPTSAVAYYVRQEKGPQWNSPVITYETKVSGNVADMKENQTYTNKAQWQLDGDLGKAGEASYTFQPGSNMQLVDKTKGAINGSSVTYTIKVNENALQINGGNAYTLTDTSGSGIDIDVSTVKISGDRASHAVSYTNHVLTIADLADSTSYTITYTASIEHRTVAEFSAKAEDFANKVDLTGISVGKTESGAAITLSEYRDIAWTMGVNEQIKFRKTDAETHEGLQGAVFTLYRLSVSKTDSTKIPTVGTDETLMGTYTTDADGYIKIGYTKTGNDTLLHDTVYVLKETTAPTGYTKSDDAIYFVFAGSDGYDWTGYKTASGKNLLINESGYTPGAVEVTNSKDGEEPEKTTTTVKISKIAVGGSEELAGAQLKVTKDGKLIEQWESGNTAHTFELEDGTYVLTEITAPNGYEKAEAITFTVATTTEEDGAKTVLVTSETEGAVTGDATDGFTVTMKDAYEEYDVTISKTDITGSNEIGGAVLKITKGEEGTGDEVTSWTSVAGQSKVVQLAAGTYTLTETTAPDGYTQAESITFVVTDDGKVQVDGATVSSVVMKDDYAAHTVKVSKIDAAGDGSTELAGAKLTIYDADGNIAKDQTADRKKADGSFADATWTSGTQVYEVELAAGTYTLVEETAPDGYTKAESIEFTIGLDGKVTSTAYLNGQLVMKDTAVDNQKEVKISKADLNGKEIKGATLIVTNNEDGSVVDRFETDGITTHSIYVEAGTYTLTEKTVPNGYEKSEDVVFNVDANGNVTIDASSKTGKVDETTGAVVMTDNWKTTKVRISKQDMAGNELKGARLTVTHMNGEATVTDDSWTSDGTTHVIEGLTPGTYTLTEKSAPKGYEVAESITFTLAADGTITTTADTDAETGAIIMQDAYKAYDVKISKVDATNSEEIAGATLTITGKTTSGETIKTITIYTDGVTLNSVKLQPGDYTLTETAAPDGYQIASSIDFTVGTDGKVNKANDAGILVMEDAPEAPSTYPVAISKQDIAGKEIKGATLSIQQRVDGKMTTVEQFETDGVNVHTVYLAAGTYRLKETITPDGYETAATINFTVNEDGSVTSEKLVNGELVMTDSWSNQTVTISKRDICGGEIAGATLKITDTEGNVVKDQTKVEGSEDLNDASWTSEAGKSHEVQLQPGTYILVEETAPTGYVKAESITFTLAADGSITANGGSVDNGTLVMTDKYADSEVQISKYAVGGSAEIAGATLKITGNTLDGKEIAPISFGTDGTEHKFSLQPGSYTLTEITAPDGYEKAESIDFTVEIGGTVKVGTDEMTGNKVTMYDKQSTAKWPVSISKMDITGANEIKGATLKITGTNVDTETVDIEFTTDGVLEHEIYLKAGNYTLTEETAPQGYQKAEQITFEVTEDGKVTNVAGGEYKAGSIVMTDKWKYQSVTISKVDIAGAEVVGAELKVTGQDAAGNKISPKTWTSTGKAQRISLLPGEYTLTETLAPDGYEKSSSIDFTVGTDGKVKVNDKETDKVVMTDKWEDTRVQISKADVNGKEIAGAVLAVTGTTKNGTTIDKIEFQSDGVNVHTFSLQPGTYTLTETTVPNGYVKAESVQFTVEVGGTIKIGEDEVSKVVMTDKAADKTIKISKEDIAGSGEVAGATLAVIDTTNSKTVDSWVSDGQTAHEVTYAFTAGQNYILKEITAPDGYDQLSSSIQFQVTNAGKVIVMSDDKIDGKEVAMVADDGTLVINNKKTVVEEPQEEPKTEENNGGNDGGDEGSTENNGGGGSNTPKVPYTAPKTEEPKVPNTQTVIIVRTDEETGEGLEGGVFELYNEDGELVGTYTTNEYGIIQVDGLEPGNYYFIEIKAPEGYEALGWDKVFTVTEGGAAEVLAVSTGRISANPDYTGSQIGEGAVSATGDDSLMTIYGSAAAMAAAVLVLWVVARRKRQHI